MSILIAERGVPDCVDRDTPRRVRSLKGRGEPIGWLVARVATIYGAPDDRLTLCYDDREQAWDTEAEAREALDNSTGPDSTEYLEHGEASAHYRVVPLYVHRTRFALECQA